MRREFSTRHLKRGLLAIAIVSSFNGIFVIPAEANFLDSVRGIFSGDSGGGASSRSRGGAIRNEYCKSDEIAASNEEIVALIPDAVATTTQANPEILLYVPFDRLNYPQIDLFLDLGEGAEATSFSYALPATPGIVRLQLPDHTALASGEISRWQIRMLCVTDGESEAVTVANDSIPVPIEGELELNDLGITALGEETSSVEGQDQIYVFQEVSGPIQRVEVSPQLAETLATTDSSLHYQAYLEEGIWLDMVSELSDEQSPEWISLLEEFELSGVDPTVQSLL